jgi:hypothetical protein
LSKFRKCSHADHEILLKLLSCKVKKLIDFGIITQNNTKNSCSEHNMSDNLPVSGYLKTERLVYFARMCSNARLMKRSVLPIDYHEYIGF